VIQVSGDDGDFPYGDWTAPYRIPAGRDAVMAAYGGSFDLLLGRRTYDSQRRPAVRSRTASMRQQNMLLLTAPESLAWGPFEGLGPDLVEGVRRIKSQDGPDIILSGSATLTSTLLEHGLADEVLLVVYPVLLGTGKRIFAKGTPPRSFELVNTKACRDPCSGTRTFRRGWGQADSRGLSATFRDSFHRIGTELDAPRTCHPLAFYWVTSPLRNDQ
jgi:dihydrofolate reductase